MSSKKNKGGKKKKGGKGRRLTRPRSEGVGSQGGGNSLAAPRRFWQRLEYPLSIQGNPTGFQSFAYPLKLNAPYDVDPAFGSTSTPGYTRASTSYAYYRVESFRVTCEFRNKEAFGGEAYLILSNTLIATAGGGVLGAILEYSAQGLARHANMSAKGGNREAVTLRIRGRTKKMLGEVTQYSAQYRANTNSSPTDLIYVNVGFLLDSAAVNGVDMTVRVTMLTSFFDQLGTQTTLLEGEMCAGCQKMTDQAKEGVIKPCCDLVRECRNCHSLIRCFTGPDVVPNPGCTREDPIACIPASELTPKQKEMLEAFKKKTPVGSCAYQRDPSVRETPTVVPVTREVTISFPQ